MWAPELPLAAVPGHATVLAMAYPSHSCPRDCQEAELPLPTLAILGGGGASDHCHARRSEESLDT